MANFFSLRGRRIARSSVALVEPFVDDVDTLFRPRTPVHGRVILLNRDSVLVHEHPIVFARENGFLWLSADGTGLNPDIAFRVESFEMREGYVLSRAFASRIVWRDFDGNEQSKLLLTELEALCELLGGLPEWE